MRGEEGESLPDSLHYGFPMIHGALFEPVAICWHGEYEKHIRWMRGRLTIPSIKLAIDHLFQRGVFNLQVIIVKQLDDVRQTFYFFMGGVE